MKTIREVEVKVFVLPGGQMPTEAKYGNFGYDAYVRAIVRKNYDKENPNIHETIWGFSDDRPGPKVFCQSQIRHDEKSNRWSYLLKHEEVQYLGLGIVLGGNSFDWVARTTKRSSLATMKGKLLEDDFEDHLNGVIVDPSFRGEIMCCIKNTSMDPIEVYRGWSPISLEFRCTCCNPYGMLRPRLVQVDKIEELGETFRGTRWNGDSNHRFVQYEFPLTNGLSHMAALGK